MLPGPHSTHLSHPLRTGAPTILLEITLSGPRPKDNRPPKSTPPPKPVPVPVKK